MSVTSLFQMARFFRSNRLEIFMRKAMVLVAVMLAAVLTTKSNVAIAADDPNQKTHNFIRDALNPYGATSHSSSHMHHMHHHGAHNHRMHRKHHMKHGKK